MTSEAIESAHAQNQDDAGRRALLRERAARKREQQDVELIEKVTALILADYPGCTEAEAQQIATHTAERGSGRVGRSAAGRQLDPTAIKLAVIAWIRHQHTAYDELLMDGVQRQSARNQISDTLQEVLNRWRHDVSSNANI